MSNDDVFSEALDDLFDEFAQTVSYTPKGGSSTDIDAIVELDGPFQEVFDRGHDPASGRITVKASDVSNPQYGGKFTFDSEDWLFNPRRGVTYKDVNHLVIEIQRDV